MKIEKNGFTLIETALVIIILSFILVPLYGLILQQREQDQTRKENAIDESVLAAVATFLKENGRYPCPADPTLSLNNANFGVEVAPADPNALLTPPGAPPAPSCVNAGIGNVNNGGGVSIGDLPFRTLGISPRMIANTKQWKYIYAVNTNSTARFDPVTGNGYNPGVASNVGVDTDGNGIADVNPQFVIVNVGNDGKGATRLSNVVPAPIGPVCGATALDSENCDGDALFVDSIEQIPGNINNATHYDDLISYSLAREESTFWVPVQNAGTGGLDIVNRNAGNVGIGTTAAPTDRLHVSGGNVRVQNDGVAGGMVDADADVLSQTGNVRAINGDVRAEAGNVRANNDVRANRNVEAGVEARSPVFTYAP